MQPRLKFSPMIGTMPVIGPSAICALFLMQQNNRMCAIVPDGLNAAAFTNVKKIIYHLLGNG